MCLVSCPWFSKSDLFAVFRTTKWKVHDLWSLLQMFLALWWQLECPLQEQHQDPPGNLKSFWEELGKFSLRQSGVSAPRLLGAISGLCKNPGMWRTLFSAPKKCQEALLRDSCDWHCCLGTWPSCVGQLLWACLSLGGFQHHPIKPHKTITPSPITPLPITPLPHYPSPHYPIIPLSITPSLITHHPAVWVPRVWRRRWEQPRLCLVLYVPLLCY